MESPNLGHKLDIGWQHCESLKEDGKVQIKCNYCSKVFKGGGIYRFKEHLAGRKGGGPVCLSVPSDVRLLMQQTLDTFSVKAFTRKTVKQKKQQNVVSESEDGVEIEPEETRIVTPNNHNQNQTVMSLSTSTITTTTRQKKDTAWKYCQMIKTDDRVHIKCNYCAKVFKGGGIHRFKEHLAGRKGASPVCFQVPSDVRILMQQNLNEVSGKLKKRQKVVFENVSNVPSPAAAAVEQIVNGSAQDGCDYDDDDDDDEDGDGDGYYVDGGSGAGAPEQNLNMLFDEVNGVNNGKSDSRKRGRGKSSVSASGAGAGAGASVGVGTDPLNIVALKTMENPINMIIGRFLYDIGANIDALDSVYFQRLIDTLSSGETGMLAPSHHVLRGWILKSLVEEIKNDINQYRKTWSRNGCSIMVEEWNTESGRTVLNFLVNCSQGTVFLKSVEASRILYSTDGLYELLKLVVEEVGSANVLQVITNSDEHYSVAGKRLMETFPSLFWAPCVFRCIDLILEDFGKQEWIYAVIEQARSVTRFVYNHSAVLNLMRRFTFGKDIVQQGLTCAATNFTMLQRLADNKLNLQTMVTSQEWMDCPYAKQLGGLGMLDIISNRSFWSSCILIIRLTSPLLQVLGIASSKKKAALGYVLAGMYRAKETIKRELVKREDYMFYWNLIDQRWNRQQHPPLHVAGFFLNPKFFYSIREDTHNEMRSSMFDCIEKLVPDSEVQDKIAKELNFYKDAVGDLGRKMAVRSRETLLPAEWWATYGGGCPNLSRLAGRILSQTCSSIGLRRNHIAFEKAYTTTNCLERKRLHDLVFVQYNLRLREMADENKNQVSTTDPISFDNMSIVEDWILQSDLCLEDYENSDWMSLVPTSSPPSMPVPAAPVDEIEDLGAGFGDYEIFGGLNLKN
ncbi:hAT transposon superfamily [Euphorbia peplus]|nr:hAT transposon superfamily [Euphorbia peplus]